MALLAYRRQPIPQEGRRLEREFDRLLATETDYWALDERIALTRLKKRSLLMLLAPARNTAAQRWNRRRASGRGSERSTSARGRPTGPRRGTL